MSHLTTDRLAALGDEAPTPVEAAHLASCDACAREHAAYRALVTLAHEERGAIGIPLTRFETIASVLAADQIVAAPAARPVVHQPARARRFPRVPMRAAAGFLLLAGGAMAGRVSAGASAFPFVRNSATAVASTSANPATATIAANFASIDDARNAQMHSEALYQQAAAYLAEHDTTVAGEGSPVAYRSRLAALDKVQSVMGEAMRQAPHDPVINGYYLTTLGQREATLRQLNTVLPASLRANSF
jgi:anti-sigma factor RsiW